MKNTSAKIKFEDMEILPMPGMARSKMSIRINMEGEMYISKKILDYFREGNENAYVDFRHSKDYRVLALKKGERNQFRLPKAGVMKHKLLKNKLQDLGYKIPAVYVFEKVEEEKMWIGRLEEVAPAPSV